VEPSIHAAQKIVEENADLNIHITLPPPPKTSQCAGGAGRAAAVAAQKMNPPILQKHHRLIVDLTCGIHHLSYNVCHALELEPPTMEKESVRCEPQPRGLPTRSSGWGTQNRIS